MTAGLLDLPTVSNDLRALQAAGAQEHLSCRVGSEAVDPRVRIGAGKSIGLTKYRYTIQAVGVFEETSSKETGVDGPMAQGDRR